ncbi:hypothetical protein AGDE_06331 [Angomonas deanei]|nr:hypothetical protein AGDE_06331 [Angomonas deanei]|eukprot:EPY37603.1 hypothetical protein AGDE_06331 [Angomonas deanei]
MCYFIVCLLYNATVENYLFFFLSLPNRNNNNSHLKYNINNKNSHAASSIAAAKSCARTILFESLRVSLFKGAIPHVMLIVDKEPNVIGKQLVEGYRLALDEYNVSPSYHEDTRRAEKGELLIPLTKGVTAPSGSVGLVTDSKISYSVVPFEHENFLENMQALQALLRDCGNQSVAEGPFQDSITRLRSYLTPLRDTVNDEALANALRHGPQRELLAFILIQKEAFQNEMKKYRLRLNLFDLGARVAEHCHLYSMSADADRLAESGAFVEALNDDQVYSYSRSCSLEPRLTYTLGTAIADAIDALSWRRQPTEGASVKPLESFDAALEDQQVWELFQPGALRWEGKKERCKGSTIVGVGEPLHIVCRDESKVLSFVGGMEDCLLNTGHYPAADSEERNSVVEHRNRFKVERKEAVEEEKEKRKCDWETQGEGLFGQNWKAEGLKPTRRSDVDSDDEEAATHERGANIFTSIGGTFQVGRSSPSR